MKNTNDPRPEEYVAAELGAAFIDVREELRRAFMKFKPFNSAHEGKAVIEEEFDELWEEIKKRQSQRDPQAMRAEAIQLAAMAIRFCVDIAVALPVSEVP